MAPQRPQPQPLRTNDIAAVGVGMSVWFVALVVLIVLRQAAGVDIPSGWVWTCLAGFVLGFYGLWFLWRRSVRARRQR